MTYLRTWKKGKRLYFALVRTRRIKRGAKKGKVVQEVVKYIGTAKDLCKFIEDAESKTRLEDVGVTKVLEYGPVLLFHKIAAMIGLREAIGERCKKSEAVYKIIEVMSAYKAFKPLSKRKMAEDYPYTAFPMLIDLPQERFYPQAMCRAMDAIKSSEMNGILSDLRKSLSLKHPVNVDSMLIDGTVITSEGTKCELLTFGYNPTGARKRQITIFLAVTEGENIPVHLRIAKGNVKAYKIFREILSDLKAVKRTFTTIVDNGFITAESLSELKKLELHIVTRLRHDSKVSKAVIRIVNGNFEEVTLYNGSKREISRAVSWNEVKERLDPEFDGIYAGFCFIAYKSYATTEEDRSAMRKKVEKAEKKLEKLKQECETKKKRYNSTMKAVFAIAGGVERFVRYEVKMTEKGAKLEYKILWEKFDREEELYEYVVLATNVPKHSNVDIMDAYTKHYDIESVYRTLKSDIEVEPIRHWKKHRVESEVFLCVLALMLRSTLAILLREKAIPLSVNELLKKIENVKLVELNGKVMKESMGEGYELLSRIV
jgi:transposase